MKRVDLLTPNKNPTFIGAWILEPLGLCEALIAYFEANKQQHKKGITADGVNLDAKNSIDIMVSPNELLSPGNEVFKTYFESLFSCYQDYAASWPFLEIFESEELHIGKFNIQRYERGQHFQRIHTERSSLGNLHRVFAWMTYLNDVDSEDGGATVFSHYGLEVQPQRGLTLIWPAEWTHAHKGNVLRQNSKYIMTGWMHFPS